MFIKHYFSTKLPLISLHFLNRSIHFWKAPAYSAAVRVPVTPFQADFSSPAVSVSPARADFTLEKRKKSAGSGF